MYNLFNFINPYFSWLNAASWSIQQCFEGLGIASSNVIDVDSHGAFLSSGFSPGEAAKAIFARLIEFLPILLGLLLIVGYIIGKRWGVAAICGLVLIPGLLGLATLWPKLELLPDTYVIGGGGALGGPGGMAPLVFLGALLGWSMLIIVADIFVLEDRFWHFYDHAWVAAGLLAGVFFVTDAQVNNHGRDLQANLRNSQQASAYLGKQLAAYDQWCHLNSLTDDASCRWASGIQQTLLDFSSAVVFQTAGPMTTLQLYSLPWRTAGADEILKMRHEIVAYNQLICPQPSVVNGRSDSLLQSGRCLVTPADLVLGFPEPLDGKIDRRDFLRPVALDSEQLVPSLVLMRNKQIKLQAKVDADVRARYFRWVYYVLFSLIAGGKIAGSTIKLFSMQKRSRADKHRFVRLLWQAVVLVGRIFVVMCRIFLIACRLIVVMCRLAWFVMALVAIVCWRCGAACLKRFGG